MISHGLHARMHHEFYARMRHERPLLLSIMPCHDISMNHRLYTRIHPALQCVFACMRHELYARAHDESQLLLHEARVQMSHELYAQMRHALQCVFMMPCEYHMNTCSHVQIPALMCAHGIRCTDVPMYR